MVVKQPRRTVCKRRPLRDQVRGNRDRRLLDGAVEQREVDWMVEPDADATRAVASTEGREVGLHVRVFGRQEHPLTPVIIRSRCSKAIDDRTRKEIDRLV